MCQNLSTTRFIVLNDNEDGFVLYRCKNCFPKIEELKNINLKIFDIQHTNLEESKYKCTRAFLIEDYFERKI